MGSRARITFSDGTSVYLEVDEPEVVTAGPGAGPDGLRPRLPGGLGPTSPVGIGDRLVDKTGAALTTALKPLMSVLESVHDSVSASTRRPDELSVQLGFKLDSALDLVFVKGHGEAAFTVTAKWNLAQSPDGGSEDADADEES
jgi:hypothetical protein